MCVSVWLTVLVVTKWKWLHKQSHMHTRARSPKKVIELLRQRFSGMSFCTLQYEELIHAYYWQTWDAGQNSVTNYNPSIVKWIVKKCPAIATAHGGTAGHVEWPAVMSETRPVSILIVLFIANDQ